MTIKPRGCAVLLFLISSLGYADVSLFIEEAVGGAGEFTGSGHAAVYFNRICADDPITLRMCRPDENGVVLSAYPEWGQEVPYKWLAVPLNIFLYGVDDPKLVPIYGNGEVRLALREAYRQKSLRKLIPDNPDGSVPEGRWRELIGVTLNRDVYALTVKTTPDQDARFLQRFLAVPNDYAFNTMFNNCADFARETMNMMFTQATGRDWINDFGITTPKALARSFTEFASGRPGLLFHIERYPQVDGTIRRSLNNRNFTEKGIVSKKYFLTMLTTKPEVLGAFIATYFITGWYHLDHEYRARPTQQVAELTLSRTHRASTVLIASTSATLPKQATPGQIRTRTNREIKQIKTELFGDKKYWKNYQRQFEPMLKDAFREGLFLDQNEFKTFYKDMELQSEPQFDASGALTLRVEDRGGIFRNVGITETNLLNPDSDLNLAYKLMLAKVNYALTAPERNRLTVPAFEEEWSLLQTIAANRKIALAPDERQADRAAEPTPFRTHEQVVTGKKRAQKLLMEVTH
jgi:hypothetical protein